MEIREADIRHFGKFENQKISFYPGINIICGENESGKSTIHAFIRAMFFGIDTRRSRSGRMDEYTLREPWDNPSWFSGSLRLVQGSDVYRIERQFNRKDRRLSLVRENDGTEFEPDDGQMTMLLGGLSEDAFRNTVFISQTGATTDEGLAEELRRYLINIQESGDGTLDLGAARNMLMRQKKELEQERKTALSEAETKAAQKRLELEYACIAAEKLENRLRAAPMEMPGAGELSETEAVPKSEEKGTESEKETAEDPVLKHFLKLFSVLTGLGGVLSALCAVLLGLHAAGILMALLSFFLFAVCVGGISRLLMPQTDRHAEDGSRQTEGAKEDIQSREGGSRETEKTDRAVLLREQESAREHCRVLREELKGLEAESDRLRSGDIRVEALDLAMERIARVSATRCRLSGSQFIREASAILSRITEGRYESLSFDAQMQVRVNTEDRLLYLWQLSYGTMNQIYFALRMAAGEMLSEDRLPVILDETFAMYDDHRLEAVLRWLDETGRQVILFTCRSREKEILERVRRGR